MANTWKSQQIPEEVIAVESERERIKVAIAKLEPLHISGCGPDLYIRKSDVLKIVEGDNANTKS